MAENLIPKQINWEQMTRKQKKNYRKSSRRKRNWEKKDVTLLFFIIYIIITFYMIIFTEIRISCLEKQERLQLSGTSLKKKKLCDKSHYNKLCDKTCVGSPILEGSIDGKYIDDSHVIEPEPFDNREYEVDHLSVVTENNKYMRLHCLGWPGHTVESVLLIFKIFLSEKYL